MEEEDGWIGMAGEAQEGREEEEEEEAEMEEEVGMEEEVEGVVLRAGVAWSRSW